MVTATADNVSMRDIIKARCQDVKSVPLEAVIIKSAHHQVVAIQFNVNRM